MSEIREDLTYTNSHEWVRDNGDGTYDFGITDNAQEQLGDMVYVELPSVGDSINSGDSFCTVESVKAASDVYAPADLEVVAVNEDLEDTPELINQNPYDDGYLITFKTDVALDLLDANAYQELVANE
jgi:glycine cleavage system H protein